MKRLFLNIIAIFIIGAGSFALAQPSMTTEAVLMARCTDDYGEMEGDNCARNDNGTCFCWDNKAE